MELVLVFLLGILRAHAQDVVAAGPDSSDTDADGLGALRYNTNSADVGATKPIGAGADRALSATTLCESEFETCKLETDCGACLALDEPQECRLDTIVDSSQCGETEEAICCISASFSTCLENGMLMKVIECIKQECSLDLTCPDDGSNSIASGPDALIDP
ncbi:unnamed protein product, partial [Pylaiella littoralis]